MKTTLNNIIQNNQLKAILIICFFVILNLLSGCSVKKNTRSTRAYHDLTSHYNVYFNGNESLKTGIRKIKKNYQEDYTNILPVFRYEDKSVATIVASDMDRTIKKCAKTIKTHSITVKPKMDKKRLSAEEVAFMAKPEYCKWIDNAYLIMGKAHFYKREFETAYQTFLLVINKYKSDDTKYDAMLWLAKTYAETNDYKNLEEVLVDLRKKKKYDKYFALQMDLLLTSMYLKQKDYNNAAQKLNSAIEKEPNRKERTREIFILGQIYHINEKYNLAADQFRTVIKRSSSYEMTFMAQIYLAEIYEKNGGNTAELKKQLKKMARDEKNIDYLDQIYYALGKIELNEKNQKKAIEYFILSSQSASSNKVQKVKTYLALGNYYYDQKNHQQAEAYYDSTLNSMETTFPDYEKINPQIKSKNALSKQLNIIQTEDSLQFVAKLPEKDRDQLINNIIQKINDEEQKALAESNTNNSTGYDPMFDDINPQRNADPVQGGKYYFYNSTSVSMGQTEFKKRWGDRKLTDNWRRSNQQADVEDNQNVVDSSEVSKNQNQDTEEQKTSNVKSRDYYLQNLPLTAEKVAQSNKRIEEAMFRSGEIYYKEINDNQMAISQFEKLLSKFQKTEYRLETLYYLYTINNKEMNYSKVETYKSMIIKEYPESVYAKVLQDPGYVEKLKKAQKDAENIYQDAYNNYKNKEYSQTINLSTNALQEYPENNLAPNFIFLTAMAYGEMGNKTELKNKLELVVLKYPDAEISKNAKATLEAIGTKKFEELIYPLNKDTIHYYVLVFPRNKTDLNKLKFKYISLNVENYTQTDLQVNVVSLDPNRDMIVVQQFKNAQTALEYYKLTIQKSLLADIQQLTPNHFVISAGNYLLFMKNKEELKYLKFFEQNYLIN